MLLITRTALAVAVVATTLTVVAPAGAEIARPPGANPSNRGYELVSLPETYGTTMVTGIGDSVEGRFQPPPVARAGGRVFVNATLPLRGQPTFGGKSAFVAVRQPSGSWARTYAGPPDRWSAFTDVASPFGWTPDFQTILWTGDGGANDPADPSPVTGTGLGVGKLLRLPLEGTPREQFDTGFSDGALDTSRRLARAITSDGRTVTFVVPGLSLAAGTPPSSVYQRTDNGPVRAVSIDPNGSAIENATLENVSSDGLRLIFAGDGGSGTPRELFQRDGSAAVRVDRARQALAAPRTDTKYVGATPDFGTVFFLTRDRLIAADTDDDADIYRWTKSGDGLQLVSRGVAAGGNGSGSDCPSSLPTTQVSSSPQGCDVAFVGAGPSGDAVYFLSPEQLDGASGAQPGRPNLYLRRGQGPVRYLLTFDASETLPYEQDPLGASGGRERNVEDDGSLLVHTIQNPRSGGTFDTPQVLRFDPATPDVLCVSCGSGGSSSGEGTLTRGDEGQLPTHNETADGRHVFFQSTLRLVPEDRNSAIDVYDYDLVTGSRSLVSGGNGQSGSYFKGVSDDGADVVISTVDSLVAEDRNGSVRKVYDVRRGGGQEKPRAVPSISCGDDACAPAGPAAPGFDLPSSSLLGASRGNVMKKPAVRVSVGAVSASQRRTLARTGKLTLKVRTSAAATVRVRAHAKVGRRTVTVASGLVRLRRAGAGRVTLHLSATARRELRARGALRVSFTTSVVGGSAAKKLSLSLRATSNRKAGAR